MRTRTHTHYPERTPNHSPLTTPNNQQNNPKQPFKDLEACVWLEQYLAEYKKCLIIVSHSQDFLNGVCTHIIWLTGARLTYYTGNYDTFRKTVAENEVVQLKVGGRGEEWERRVLCVVRCVFVHRVCVFFGGCGCALCALIVVCWPPLRRPVKIPHHHNHHHTTQQKPPNNKKTPTKAFQKEQEDIKHIKQFIASCGTFCEFLCGLRRARALAPPAPLKKPAPPRPRRPFLFCSLSLQRPTVV